MSVVPWRDAVVMRRVYDNVDCLVHIRNEAFIQTQMLCPLRFAIGSMRCRYVDMAATCLRCIVEESYYADRSR